MPAVDPFYTNPLAVNSIAMIRFNTKSGIVMGTGVVTSPTATWQAVMDAILANTTLTLANIMASIVSTGILMGATTTPVTTPNAATLNPAVPVLTGTVAGVSVNLGLYQDINPGTGNPYWVVQISAPV